jgi:hypothetical protein
MTVPSPTKDFESSCKKGRKNFTFKLENIPESTFFDDDEE